VDDHRLIRVWEDGEVCFTLTLSQSYSISVYAAACFRRLGCAHTAIKTVDAIGHHAGTWVHYELWPCIAFQMVGCIH
jgi:hypothetical protein